MVFAAALFFARSGSAAAASITINAKESSFALNESFVVSVLLDTDAASANAIEGTIVFPPNLLEVEEIRDGKSIITFWLERPKTSDDSIAFSGITPGGFLGEKQVVLDIVFKTTHAGSGMVAFQNARVLQNDGRGTELLMEKVGFSFLTREEPADSSPVMTAMTDSEPPEAFTPIIARDPNMLAGKYVIIFATKDKGSGISRYEVREGKWGEFTEAESPYVIRHPSLGRTIYVRAIDKMGNERLAVAVPEDVPINDRKGMLATIALGVLALLAVTALYIRGRKSKR